MVQKLELRRPDGSWYPARREATRIRKYRDYIHIFSKSIQKIRKAYISSLLDGCININEIQKQVGHMDERPTLKNYCFNQKTSVENENNMEKSLAV
ncbi:hypothetical protein [Lacrimispora sp. JR3]|uniref:hypothetical protein n=1 Tax=Lacrimispora sinapis TaxID=3111456 RepID=UPI0037496252